MNKSKITNVVLDGIDLNDSPDFVDAFIVSANYDGEPMDEYQLEEINEDLDFVHECVLNRLG